MNEEWKLVGILSFLLSIPAIMAIYPFLNTPAHGVHLLVTRIDNDIPFLKIFVIPYIAWIGYLAITLIYLCFKDRRLAFRTILVFDLGLLACFLIYYFFQTQGPVRPEITGQDYLSQILNYVYQIDQPYNSFPSIHVMSSYLMIRAIRNSSWKTKWDQWIIGGCSTSIILATLFIKQHFILDVAAAMLLVECLFKGVEIVNQWFSIPERDDEKQVAGKPSSYTT